MPIGIVSDTGFDMRPVFEVLGLAPYLSTVVMSFQLGVCKPATSGFLMACQRLGVRPDRTLMVGDNPLTDSGAVAAGMHVLLLPRAPKSGPRGLGHVLSLVS
jgi:putative hydrolase of the HAD superfamily